MKVLNYQEGILDPRFMSTLEKDVPVGEDRVVTVAEGTRLFSSEREVSVEKKPCGFCYLLVGDF
jgi:hypothetical protein